MESPLIQFLVMPLAKIAVLLVLLLLLVAYMTFFERKLLAYIQVRLGPNRVGPKGWLQPIADGLKLFVKEDVVPASAQKFVFMLAPCLIMVPAFVVFAVIPFGAPFDAGFGFTEQPIPVEPILADINIALLFILGVSSIGGYGIILGGWSSNNKFSLMGGLRSAAQMVSYEVPMGFAVVAVVLMSGSLSLTKIVESQGERGMGLLEWNIFWLIIPGLLAFGTYFICGVAETNRNPFDLPEAESELVAGFHTEYSGMKFALFFLAEYANMIVISCLVTVMFLGGWLSPIPGLPDSVLWFFAKMAIFLFCYIWFRGTFPRYRFDQLMHIGWKWLLPLSLANIFLVGLLKLILKGLSA
jgi:NADH-quinone oxidoreductase subunit H